MGLIQELTKFLENKNKAKIENLEKENQELHEKLCKVLYERDKFEEQAYTLKRQKESALDEVVINQKRIDALLRQLSEKNGGK